VLPALVVLFPAEWFVLRSVGTAAIRQDPIPAGELVAGSLAALAAAYLVSVGVVSAVRASATPPLVDAVLRPSNRTLRVLGVVLVGAAGYFLLSLFVTVTGPLGTGLAVVGLLFGLPLVLAYTASVAVTNVLGVDGIGPVAVVVGLAASAVWTVGLAAAVGTLLDRLGWDGRVSADGRPDERRR
jgi:hypothetical protein